MPPNYLSQLQLTQADWQQLLAPITPELPTGEYLVYEGTYDNIRQARRQDDPSLPQGDWKTKLKKADWGEVQTLSLKALSYQSKDVQIVAWLTEAWLYLYGYLGLKAGLHLCLQLCEHYWPDLFPPIEEDDLELRLSPFRWFNEKLTVQLGHVPITAPASSDVLAYSFLDRESAWLLENRPAAEKQAAEAEGKPTRAKFLTSATLTPRTFCAQISSHLQDALTSVTVLNQFLDNACGKQSPSLGQLQQMLMDIQRVVDGIVKEKPAESITELEASVEAALEIDEHLEQMPTQRSPTTVSPIRSRAEAYQRLAEVADYLLNTEPHSPTPYLIKRAISWGNLSLTELLMELVNDDKDLQAIYSLLGIKQE